MGIKNGDKADKSKVKKKDDKKQKGTKDPKNDIGNTKGKKTAAEKQHGHQNEDENNGMSVFER